MSPVLVQGSPALVCSCQAQGLGFGGFRCFQGVLAFPGSFGVSREFRCFQGVLAFPGNFGVSREFWRFQGISVFQGNFGVSREFWCFRGISVFPHCSWVGKAALGGAGAALRVLWRLKRELFTICSWAGMLNIGRGCRDSGCPEGVRNAWMWHSGLGTGWDQLLRVTLRFFPSPVIWDSCFKGAAPPVCSFLLGVCPGQG